MTGVVLSLLLVASRQDQAWPTRILEAGSVQSLEGQTYKIPSPKAKATVILFVTVDCPVCNRYAPEISRIVGKYGKQVAFFLAYTDPSVSRAAEKKHRKDFGLRAQAFEDTRHTWVRKTGATVTPEAAVLGPEGKLLYRGRIDDLFTHPGDRKPRAERFDLRNALDQVLAGKRVTEPVVPAVGCAISSLR